MRNIWILVKREMRDHAIHFGLAFLMGCLGSAIIYVVYRTADARGRLLFGDLTSLFFIGLLPCFMVLDVTSLARVQIAGDCGAKVSAFMCTLTCTRGQLLTAKWISGLIWICLAVGPLLVTLALKGEQIGQFAPFIKPVMLGLIVTHVTGYAMGQQVGFLEDKGLILVVGALFLCLLASLLVIKGLAIPCYGLLAFLTVALCVRSWWAFHHMAL
jgi:hypothetical protein